MINTVGLGAGSYPEPPEEVIDDDEYDFGWDLADEYYEESKLNE